MRVLLVSLWALLLCAAVAGHPLARHRINRARSPFRQIATAAPKPVAADPPKQDDDISGSFESSAGAENEANGDEGSKPTAPMLTRRKGDCGSSSEDTSGSRGRSRSGCSKSEDVEGWLQNVRERCGMKLEMLDKMEKVSPNDVRNVMMSADDVTKKIVDSFSQHRNDIAELEANMKGQSAEKLVSAHVHLLTQFQSLIDSAKDDGICEIASMQMLLDRIAKLGTVDFADSRCNQAYQMVTEFGMEYGDMNSPGRITLMWLYSFGEALRNDMHCIIQDIEAVGEKVSTVRHLAEAEHNPAIRDVNIGISTVMAYVNILETELDQFRHAIDVVGEALHHVNLQELEAAAMPMSKRYRMINAMKRLLHKV